MTKSPSGSICPYNYKGGELHPLKYGSFYQNKEQLFTVMKAEEEYIQRASGKNNRRIWIDLYHTRLDREVVQSLVEHIIAIEPKIYKLCLVGCPLFARMQIKRQLKAANRNLAYGVQFFSDPEEAKQWLLQESET